MTEARSHGAPFAKAIGRSLDIYYRDSARTERMDRLNSAFVAEGLLTFDIGAHLGDRTASFVRLGASVVAVEPHPRVFRALRLLHGRTPGVTLEWAAVGARDGDATLFENTQNPTVSTLSPEFIASAATAPEWQGQIWDQRRSVRVLSLDTLIDTYGVPGFVKIDVEGHEHEVLQGLSQPLPAISFEFTTHQRDVAARCLDLLERLGRFEYNLSLGEDHRLRRATWCDGHVARADLMSLPDRANSGDIYARQLP